MPTPRRKKKGKRGYVDQITPETQSGESDAQYSRRTSRSSRTQDVQKKSNARRIVFMALGSILVIAIGIAAGIGVYFGQSNSRLSLDDGSVADVLVEPTDGQAFYALCVAELGTSVSATSSVLDAYVLLRIDTQNRAVSLVNIPSRVSVELSDSNMHPLCDALDVGGDAELIAAVSTLAGVEISHYARTNAEGIAHIVDMIGGITLDLAEEIDDPVASTMYIQAGRQTLDGQSVIAVLRSSNFSNGIALQAENRIDVMLAMAQVVLVSEGLGFASELAGMADSVQTSWEVSEIMDLCEILRPFDTLTVYQAVLPGHQAGDTYVKSNAQWDLMMENVEAGIDPSAPRVASDDLDKGSVSVEVRNGGGVTGAGARMGQIITDAGYQLTEVGNTDDGTTYPETLVIYHDDAYRDAAEAVVADIATGRVVNGGDFYDFETSILIIVGKDWMPVS